jgi:hypothetical protein
VLQLLKPTSLPVESSSGTSTGISNTGEVGSKARLAELNQIPANNIQKTNGFLGRFLAKPTASATNPDETLAVESKATEKNAAPEPSTEAANSSEETPTLLNLSDLAANLQKSLKFLSAENKGNIQAIKVKSDNPEVENYQIMFTGKAAKQLFLNTFQKILHGMNLFGKSDTPDKAATLLTESDRDKSYLSKALANDNAYLQAQFSVPVNVKEKAEIQNISITESPFNLQNLLLARKDLTVVVLNAAKEIIKEQPNISMKSDLEGIIQALEKKDKQALTEAFKPFARTYSLEALKAPPEDTAIENSLIVSAEALTLRAINKGGLKPTIVMRGTEAQATSPDAIAIQDMLLPTNDGKFKPSAITIINQNAKANVSQLIFYTLLTMTDSVTAGKPLDNKQSQALTEAIVQSTINADSQAKAAVAHLN